LEKICNAIGLPPVLCVFLALGLFIGLLGIARTINGTAPITDGTASRTL
jgi:hypothetical protein